MSRTTERARASFYRASGGMRLASVVCALVVIGMMVGRAADPASWVWLTGERTISKAVTPVAVEAPQAAAEEVAPGPTDADSEERAAAAEQFQALTDRTLALAREEMPAYWRLFSWTDNQSLADLERRAAQTPVLNQFMQSPDEQRGQLFQLELNVRRVLSYEAPANSAGIEKVYEIWGWTTESKAWLYVVLTAHLPPGMPVGPDVNERVTFAGYFLKLQGYHAAGAGPKDKPLAAPLLIGRVAWTAPPTAAATSSSSRWMQGMATFVLLLGALGLAIWTLIPKSASRQRAANSLRPAATRAEVRDWLVDAAQPPMKFNPSRDDFHIHDN